MQMQLFHNLFSLGMISVAEKIVRVKAQTSIGPERRERPVPRRGGVVVGERVGDLPASCLASASVVVEEGSHVDLRPVGDLFQNRLLCLLALCHDSRT